MTVLLSRCRPPQVAICRVEQLSPFPFDLVSRDIRRFPNATPMWVQEEPQVKHEACRSDNVLRPAPRDALNLISLSSIPPTTLADGMTPMVRIRRTWAPITTWCPA